MKPNRDTPAKRAARRQTHTWADIKAMVELQGVRDEDRVFSIDIGPYANRVTVDRTIEGVEVEDDSSDVLDG